MLSEEFDQSEMYIRSDDEHRTRESVQCLFSTLYDTSFVVSKTKICNHTKRLIFFVQCFFTLFFFLTLKISRWRVFVLGIYVCDNHFETCVH